MGQEALGSSRRTKQTEEFGENLSPQPLQPLAWQARAQYHNMLWSILQHVPLRVRPQFLRCSCRSSSTTIFPTTFPYGLTNSSTTSAHFTTALDMTKPLLLRNSAEDFMTAARADAGSEPVGAWLAKASLKCETYLRTGEVYDRQEIRGELLGVLEKEGQMALFMGGKSVGKSLLLRELARTPIVGRNGVPRMVVLINGRRSGGDLALGVARALQRVTLEDSVGSVLQGMERTPEDRARNSALLERLRTSVGKVLPFYTGVPMTAGNPADAEDLLDTMVEIARKEGVYLCLVIDEGNLALPSPSAPGGAPQEGEGTEEELKRQLRYTKALLNHLVLLTKESRSLNVLISTSEYAYPYRLQHGNFFNATNLTRTLMAGELSPASMRALLMGTWGLGPRLTDVFLAYLGGHIHLAAQALDRLASTLDGFDVLEAAPSLCAVGVNTCLREGGEGARTLLNALAVAGWAGVGGPQEPALQSLARGNLGGFVDQSAIVVGVPQKLRRSGASGLGAVPSFHYLRHVVAHRLALMGGEGRAAAAAAASPRAWGRSFY